VEAYGLSLARNEGEGADICGVRYIKKGGVPRKFLKDKDACVAPQMAVSDVEFATTLRNDHLALFRNPRKSQIASSHGEITEGDDPPKSKKRPAKEAGPDEGRRQYVTVTPLEPTITVGGKRVPPTPFAATVVSSGTPLAREEVGLSSPASFAPADARRTFVSRGQRPRVASVAAAVAGREAELELRRRAIGLPESNIRVDSSAGPTPDQIDSARVIPEQEVRQVAAVSARTGIRPDVAHTVLQVAASVERQEPTPVPAPDAAPPKDAVKKLPSHLQTALPTTYQYHWVSTCSGPEECPDPTNYLPNGIIRGTVYEDWAVKGGNRKLPRPVPEVLPEICDNSRIVVRLRRFFSEKPELAQQSDVAPIGLLNGRFEERTRLEYARFTDPAGFCVWRATVLPCTIEELELARAQLHKEYDGKVRGLLEEQLEVHMFAMEHQMLINSKLEERAAEAAKPHDSGAATIAIRAAVAHIDAQLAFLQRKQQWFVDLTRETHEYIAQVEALAPWKLSDDTIARMIAARRPLPTTDERGARHQCSTLMAQSSPAHIVVERLVVKPFPRDLAPDASGFDRFALSVLDFFGAESVPAAHAARWATPTIHVRQNFDLRQATMNFQHPTADPIRDIRLNLAAASRVTGVNVSERSDTTSFAGAWYALARMISPLGSAREIASALNGRGGVVSK